MSTQQQTGLVILKSAVVPTTPERAFEVFTDGIATWWPLDTHSVEATVAPGPSSSRPGRRVVSTKS